MASHQTARNSRPFFPGPVRFPKKQIEPSGALAGSSRGGNQAAGAGGTGRGGGGGGHSGATAAGRRDSGVYCYDPWGGWVLENYSLYTTVLAAFVRKVGNMSFKVRA